MINNKGKMVYCKETFQIFPSAKIAAETHKIGYWAIASHLNGRSKSAGGKHYVYIENTSDLSNFFASKRREEKEREEMRRAAEARVSELTQAHKELSKQLAEARKQMRKM